MPQMEWFWHQWRKFWYIFSRILSCSKPVITTNKVNIYKSILKYKAGFISKNNSSDFSKIKKFCKLNKKSKIVCQKIL